MKALMIAIIAIVSLFLYIIIGALCYKIWTKWSRDKDDEVFGIFIAGWPLSLPMWLVGMILIEVYQLAINIILRRDEQPKKDDEEIFTFRDFLSLR